MKIYDQQLAESLQAKEAAHTSEAPNFIQKDDCTAKSPDLKTCGVSAVVEERTYKDLVPKTMDGLRKRLHFSWKNVT